MKNIFFLSMLFFQSMVFSQIASPCDLPIPSVNQEILKSLKPFLGKKIDRGECWDVAKYALDKIQAKWDGFLTFGKEISIEKECIFPGDVIQFEKAVFTGVDEKGFSFKESFYHHTAIVYSVSAAGKVELIHQNTGQFGKKVGISKLDLNQLTEGVIKVFRPER